MTNEITDAKNPACLFKSEQQKFKFERDFLNDYHYIRLLPNRRQKYSDLQQLKSFPGYRLIEPDCDCDICFDKKFHCCK